MMSLSSSPHRRAAPSSAAFLLHYNTSDTKILHNRRGMDSSHSPRGETTSELPTLGGCFLSLILSLIAMGFSIWIMSANLTGQWNVYRLVDEHGWIEHDHDTPVWIKGEWLADEYRVCQIPLVPNQTLPDSAHLLCGQSEVLIEEDLWSPDFIRGLSDLEFAELMAGRWPALDQHFHILPVHYWGRIDRSDRRMFSWRCQKRASGLVCKALN